MAKKTDAPPKYKISQLAKTAGVSVSTIKFYLKEGLIDPPTPGDGSMSYYSQDHVNRILLIKRLQKERFFPLNVIKRMIATDSAEPDAELTATMEETAWEPGYSGDPVPIETVIARSGYPLDKIDLLEKEGFIHSRATLQGRLFDAVDLEILMLFKTREEAGLPFDHTRQVFSIYHRHIRKAVNEDVLLCVRNVLFQKEGADMINYITEGEKTVEAYLNLCKIKFTRMRVNDILGRHETVPIRIVEALNFRSLEGMAQQLREKPVSLEYTALLETILSGTPPDTPGASTVPQNTGDTNTPAVRHLVNGLLDMIEGNSAGALDSFGHIDPKDTFAPLAASLKGLAQITQISRIASMIVFVKEMRTVLDYFEQSRTASPNPVADLFAAYGRLVGITVRPNFFDIETDAEPEFNDIMRRSNQLLDKIAEEAFLKPFLKELVTKTFYFMVLMHQECDKLPQAEGLLKQILAGEKDVFYTTWAQRKLYEINSLNDFSS